MAKAKTTEAAEILSVTEGDETVAVSLNAEGTYSFTSKVKDIESVSASDLIQYLKRVQNLEIGQTKLVRDVAPILIDKIG